jgi:hypothetical protein
MVNDFVAYGVSGLRQALIRCRRRPAHMLAGTLYGELMASPSALDAALIVSIVRGYSAAAVLELHLPHAVQVW